MVNLKLPISRRTVLATLLGSVAASVQAMNAFPALSRAALTVRAPERQFMLAAAKVGKRIVAVGERGVIVLSDNAGKTWKQATRVPVSVTLTAVCFINQTLGWAVGHGGTVLHTTDAGETWDVQANGEQLAKAALQEAEEFARLNPTAANAERLLKSAQRLLADGPDKPLLDVRFRDANHGWVVGAFNMSFETKDGGKTWTGLRHLVDNPKELHLYSLHLSASEMYIVGEQGQMHRSGDGGQSFQALKSPYNGSWFCVSTSSDGAVVAGGLRGNLFRSINHGESWQKIEGLPPVSLVSITPLSDGRVLLANQAGQLFTLGTEDSVAPLKSPPLPPLSSALQLSAGALLVVGAVGVMPVAVNLVEPGTSK